MNVQDAISKARKLLALAHNNTNENECAAARSAADRIIQEYRLSQADLVANGTEQDEEFVRKTVREGGRRVAWMEYLLHELCAHYGGAFYFSSVRVGGCGGRGGGKGGEGFQRYTVVARESDFEIISYMFEYLSGEVERLGKHHCKGLGMKFASGWRVGCAHGIAEQFQALRASLRAEENVNKGALVILDKRAGEAQEEMRRGGVIRTANHVSGGRDHNGRIAGVATGRTVNIRQGLPAAATSDTILSLEG